MSSTIKVKPEQLAAAIRKELESYSKAATEETKELIRETAKICKEEIQSASPVRTGKYRKGWSIKPLWEDNDSLREIVRNRSAWQLTHLLENGHAKKNGGRVICVGTTSCRTLESVTDDEGIVHAKKGWTDIFITPGYKFKAVDKLITNFHLPESTLLMLVSALCTREEMLDVYKHAVEEKYRFFSFGDAMLIL